LVSYKSVCLTAAALIAFLAGSSAFGQSRSEPMPIPPKLDAGWESEQWTGNDAPYAEAKVRIEREVDASRNPDSLVAAYRRKAQLCPKSPYAVFCWAVAYCEAPETTTSLSQSYANLYSIVTALASAPSPRNYDYARIRYIYEETGNWMGSYDLKVIADRLLAANKNDASVLISVAESSTNLPYALTLLDQAIKITPESSAAYWVLGNTYMAMWNSDTKNRELGRKAISAYKKFLSLSKANVSNKEAEQYISIISSVMATGKPPAWVIAANAAFKAREKSKETK